MVADSFSSVAFDKAPLIAPMSLPRGDETNGVGERPCPCAYAAVARRWLSSAVPEPPASSREPGAEPTACGPHSPVWGRAPGRATSKPAGGRVALGRLSSQKRTEGASAQPDRATPAQNTSRRSRGHCSSCGQMGLSSRKVQPALQRTILRLQIARLGAASSPFWAMPDHGALRPEDLTSRTAFFMAGKPTGAMKYATAPRGMKSSTELCCPWC